MQKLFVEFFHLSILLEHTRVREGYFGGVGVKMQDFHSEDHIP